MATDTAVIIIALVLVPSHTISIGASADFGRLLRTTMKGSRQSERPLNQHRRIANIMPTMVIIANATSVSYSVTHICMNITPSLARSINVWYNRTGELNINALIIPLSAVNSHMQMKPKNSIRRESVTDIEYIRCLITNLRCKGLIFILTPPLFHQNISGLKEYLLIQYQLFLKVWLVCS